MLSRGKNTGLWLAIAVLLVGAAPSRIHPTVGCSPATFTTSKGAKLIEATYNGTRYTFQVIRAGASALADINWGDFSLVRSVQLVTPDGRVANQLVFTDPTEQLRSDIRYRIKQIVKDQNGNDLKNEAGETVASLEPAPGNKAVLAVVKDLPENVKTRIASFDEPTRQWFTSDYFAENSSAFRSAMDARPELVDAWKALDNIGVDDVIRKNPDYLKNIDDYAKRSGKNVDEVADLAKNNENGIEQFLDELGASSSGVWSQNPFKRGQDIEQALGHNLPRNFPVIDKFENGLATSIKSIDLNAKTYQDVTKLEYRLKNYVDKVAGFNGQAWAEVVIKSSDVKTRALDLAIPFNGSTAQQGILNQIVNYGTSKGVTVNIIIYP